MIEIPKLPKKDIDAVAVEFAAASLATKVPAA
jgi:hypothetical protein